MEERKSGNKKKKKEDQKQKNKKEEENKREKEKGRKNYKSFKEIYHIAVKVKINAIWNFMATINFFSHNLTVPPLLA